MTERQVNIQYAFRSNYRREVFGNFQLSMVQKYKNCSSIIKLVWLCNLDFPADSGIINPGRKTDLPVSEESLNR